MEDMNMKKRGMSLSLKLNILIVISIVLTVIAGIIPSRMAMKCDPVTALRTE